MTTPSAEIAKEHTMNRPDAELAELTDVASSKVFDYIDDLEQNRKELLSRISHLDWLADKRVPELEADVERHLATIEAMPREVVGDDLTSDMEVWGLTVHPQAAPDPGWLPAPIRPSPFRRFIARRKPANPFIATIVQLIETGRDTGEGVDETAERILAAVQS